MTTKTILTDPTGMPKRVWLNLLIQLNRTVRKFHLNDTERDELATEMRYHVIAAPQRNYSRDGGASLDTFLNSVINHKLATWKHRRFEATVFHDQREDDARRILYSPTRYGQVRRMVLVIDFNAAFETLDDDEQRLARLLMTGMGKRQAAARLHISKTTAYERWRSICQKFARAYHRRLPEQA